MPKAGVDLAGAPRAGAGVMAAYVRSVTSAIWPYRRGQDSKIEEIRVLLGIEIARSRLRRRSTEAHVDLVGTVACRLIQGSGFHC